MQFYRTYAARIIDETGRCPRDAGARTTAYLRPKPASGGAGPIDCPACGRQWGVVSADADDSTHGAGRPPLRDVESVPNVWR